MGTVMLVEGKDKYFYFSVKDNINTLVEMWKCSIIKKEASLGTSLALKKSKIGRVEQYFGKP